MTWTQSIVFTFLSLIQIILMSAIIRLSCLLTLQSENTCYHGHLEVVHKSRRIERLGGLKKHSCQVNKAEKNGCQLVLFSEVILPSRWFMI